ncbi:MAG: CDP-glycerol glycerophosphotransferase family protein [Burkholderiales bacterium]|nr:CDP-glycerol glycerophosphotransferase family protein [Burkholderiales bacterium]
MLNGRRYFTAMLKSAKLAAEWLLYWASGWVPKTKGLWVFGSWHHSFSENSKYLFLYVASHRKDIRAVWITRSPDVVKQLNARGYEAKLANSFAGLLACLRASIYFFVWTSNDINFFTSRGAVRVNLWHGSPIKRINWDIQHGPLARIYHHPSWMESWVRYPDMLQKATYVLARSNYEIDYCLASAFRLPKEQCLNLGHPRLDALLSSREEVIRLTEALCDDRTESLVKHFLAFRHVVLYMPTWREAHPDFLPATGLDPDRIHALCADTDTLFAIKLHPNSPVSAFERVAQKSNRICLIRGTVDPYPLMALTNVLVTDYSSVLMEFILTGRPMILFPFDLQEYTSDSRSFYFDYQTVAFGPIARTADQLMTHLERALHGRLPAGYSNADVARFDSHRDRGAAGRIANHFLPRIHP